MKTYVISLKSECNRRKHMISQFNEKNVQFDFFDALTPQFAFDEAKSMGFIIKEDLISGGEVACFMSHVALWRKMIDENIQYLAIFEDDVILSDDANEFLSSSSWIKHNWDIVKIEKFNKKAILSSLQIVSQNSKREVSRLLSKHYGCAGYIISLNAAKQLINYLNKNPKLIPLDHIVFEYFIPESDGVIVQLNPAICIQHSILMNTHDNFPSSLELDRRKRMKGYKKKKLAKVYLEILRVFQQLRLKLFGKNIEFK